MRPIKEIDPLDFNEEYAALCILLHIDDGPFAAVHETDNVEFF